MSFDTKLPEEFRYTIVRRKPGMEFDIRGCLDWNRSSFIFLKNDNDAIIRIRKGKELIGQLVIKTGIDHLENGNTYPLLEAWIYCFAIKPEYRKQGLGSKLLKRAEKYIKENCSCNCIKLHAQKEFENKLIPFYIDHGYYFIDIDPVCKNEPVFFKAIENV